MDSETNKRKLSVSPEANKSKKHQGSDLCVSCKIVISRDDYSIQCQWCKSWEHSKCANIKDEECIIISESSQI